MVPPEELPVELVEERRLELRSELRRRRPLSSSLEVKTTRIRKEKVRAKERRTMVCAMKNETKESAISLAVSSSTTILIPEHPRHPPEHGAVALGESEEAAAVKVEEKEQKSSRRSSTISFANTSRPENLQIVSKGGGNVSTAT